jgi:monofunctional biosynthetic peptidoglycan transglycosylase
MFKKLTFIVFLVALAIIVPSVWYLVTLPDVRQFSKVNPPTTAIRMYREKQMREKGGKPRSVMVWRRLDQISPYLAQAVVLSEDDTFFSHNGFDVEQIKRAARINWERKRFAFGGSTLTQQLARTLYLSSHKNLLRKAKEALIARRLEEAMPKRRILELYLNCVEWGPQIYGAEAASRHFFGKPASDLLPEEAIALAVILPSPRKWNPLSDRKFITHRKNVLYDRMVRAHYIVPEPTPEPSPDVFEEIPLEELPTDQ